MSSENNIQEPLGQQFRCPSVADRDMVRDLMAMHGIDISREVSLFEENNIVEGNS